MDGTANIAWYQGAALVFTSWGDEGDVEKHRQEAKQKAFIQHQRHTGKYDEGFELCGNGFNGNPTRFMSKKRKKILETTQMLHFV